MDDRRRGIKPLPTAAETRNNEFNRGVVESKESLAGTTVQGTSIGTVGSKFHGYDKNSKSVNY